MSGSTSPETHDQVFLLFETSPSDPYADDRLLGVYDSMDAAMVSDKTRPTHPWGRPGPDGTVEAKPRGDAYYGRKIVPTRLLKLEHLPRQN